MFGSDPAYQILQSHGSKQPFLQHMLQVGGVYDISVGLKCQLVHQTISGLRCYQRRCGNPGNRPGRTDLAFVILDKTAFESAKPSIDYAVIEKTALAAVLPVSFS